MDSIRKLSMEELNRVSIDEFKKKEKIPVIVLLDNVRSLHNVGSVFRTCDAFCIEKLILTGITGAPPHREINKTALGATESVLWEYQEDPIEAVHHLKKNGYIIVAVEQTNSSKKLDTFEISGGKFCLIFGNEVDGVNNHLIALSDVCIEIPQKGTKHSLNIAVSAGIVIWAFFKNYT